MKKPLIFLIAFTLIFSACGSGGEPSDETGGDSAYTYSYKTAEFQLEVLDDWEIIDTFGSEYPEGMRVAFRNDVKDSIFTSNVSVLFEDNINDDTSYDFAQRKKADHEDTLLNYKLLEQETITLDVEGAESKSVLFKFQGKNETSGPTLEFMQVTLTDGEEAWTATATYRPSEDEFIIEQMEIMLRSFTLR